MSMFSIISSRCTPGFPAVFSKAYRFTTIMSMGTMPCSSIELTCAGFSRRCRMPPWTMGWSVLTRPSSISGKPVSSEMSLTLMPASRSSFAVPPVETSSTSMAARCLANSTRPVLSVTERMARSIFDMGPRWQYRDQAVWGQPVILPRLCARAVFRPECGDSQAYRDSDGDLNEAVDRDDPPQVRAWHECDDGNSDAGVAVSAPLHAKACAENPQQKYCDTEDQRIPRKVGGRQASGDGAHRCSGHALCGNRQGCAQSGLHHDEGRDRRPVSFGQPKEPGNEQRYDGGNGRTCGVLQRRGVVFGENELPDSPRAHFCPSSSSTSVYSAWFAGVGTPSSAPRRTIWPLRDSISVRLPRFKSCPVDESCSRICVAIFMEIAKAAARSSTPGSAMPAARATASTSSPTISSNLTALGLSAIRPYRACPIAETGFKAQLAINLTHSSPSILLDTRQGTPPR